ncbi:hypothetical protein [Halosimplex sp. J119]
MEDAPGQTGRSDGGTTGPGDCNRPEEGRRRPASPRWPQVGRDEYCSHIAQRLDRFDPPTGGPGRRARRREL